MNIHIVLNDELVNEMLSLTGISSKRELINLALKEFSAELAKKGFISTGGSIGVR